MRLEDKNKIIDALHKNRQHGCIGQMYGPYDSACALGHIYEAFGVPRLVRGSDLVAWSHMVNNLVNDIGLNETYKFPALERHGSLSNICSLSNIIIYMNDDLWEDLDVIADWIQDNVIADDTPDTVPTDWEIYETV